MYSIEKASVLDSVERDYAIYIMRKLLFILNKICVVYKWNIKQMKEFYPRSNSNLLGLNVNKGELILVKFKKNIPVQDKFTKPKRRKKHVRELEVHINKNAPLSNINTSFQVNTLNFYSFEEICCTALHELAHCSISSHNKQFWELCRNIINYAERIIIESMKVSSIASTVQRPHFISPENGKTCGVALKKDEREDNKNKKGPLDKKSMSLIALKLYRNGRSSYKRQNEIIIDLESSEEDNSTNKSIIYID